MLVGGKATTPHLQIIRHQEKPGPYKFVFSMWSFDEAQFFDVFDAYCRFCRDYARAHRLSLRPAGGRLSHGARTRTRCCPSRMTRRGSASIPCRPAVRAGTSSSRRSTNSASAHNGHPLFNQTKHLTPAQVGKAFGKRWGEFAQARRARDPGNRLLSSYFAKLLTSADPT